MKYLVCAEYIQDYRIRVTFNTGEKHIVDLEKHVGEGIFAPLKDKSYFTQFVVHPELETIVWPNGADFAPEFLASQIKDI